MAYGMSDILNELRRLKEEKPAETPPEPKEEQEQPKGNPQEDVLTHKWYQIGDWFTRTDELLEAILLQLQEMGAVTPAPPTLPPTPTIPPGIEPKLEAIAVQQTRTKELLEGFNFLTGQAIVQTAGTPVELISTIKTYLVIIRAHLTNAGDIYLGGKGVGATTSYILDPGSNVAVAVDCLKKTIWMDAANSGDGVSWFALVD